MRILLIAPGELGINSTPEVRSLSSLHSVYTLSGKVTVMDVFNATSAQKFDVVHFATHGSPDGLALSDGDVLSGEDLVYITKSSGTYILFINACNTAKLANYVVAHTTASVISTSIDIDDEDAWKLPLIYYANVARREQINHVTDRYKMLVEEFVSSAGTDGTYGITINHKNYLARIDETYFANFNTSVQKIADNMSNMESEFIRLSKRSRTFETVEVILILVVFALLITHLYGVI